MVYSQDEYERIGNLQELGTIDNLNGLLTVIPSFWQKLNKDLLGTTSNLNGLLTQTKS